MKRCMGCMKEYEEEYDLCPHCGYLEGEGASEYHLPPGSMLAGKYQVGKVMGFGGFGVTYIGWDLLLERRVAIKEYLPSQYATRTREDYTLTIYSGEKEQKFLAGMEKFSDEAKRLAKFQGADGIVQIYDTFMENKTAYIVMEYLEGETLKDRLEREGRIPVDEAIELMMPVLESLEIVHREGILHRDIAPDNVFLCKDEKGNTKAKLLDFGAARFATSHHSRSLSVLVKEGYSPYEQYRSDGEQGTWTDVYAVAATLYHMITGIKPQNSMERYSKDQVASIRKLGVKIDKSTEAAIMNAMNITYEYRTHDATAFLEELRSDQVKRIRDKIIRTDIGRWPKWLKAVTSAAAAAVVVFVVLLVTGVIHFDIIDWGESKVPDGMTRVPNLINMSEDKAAKKAKKSELIFQILDKEYSDEIPAGRVLSQTMLGGSVVEEECTIGVVISGGVEKTYVPDVVHFMESSAAEMIYGANLAYETLKEPGDDAPGSVISQDVEANTEVDAGTELQLVVSTGMGFDATVETVAPNVTGMNYDAGKTLALESCLYLAKEELVYDQNVPKDQIVEQSPAAGEAMSQDGVIMVKVSAGAATTRVPDVQYKELVKAQEMMEASHLVVQIEYEDNEDVQKDHVIRQSVEAGQEVEMGTTVILYISKGNEKADNSLNGGDAVVTQDVQEQADQTAQEQPTVKPEETPAKPDDTKKPEETPAKPDDTKKPEDTKKPDTPREPEDTTIPVPKVIGKAQAEAERELASAGFSCSVVEAYSDTVEQGKVISQSVAAGTKMEPGTLILLTVSKGPETVAVPNVVGKSRADAESALSAAGLKCNVTEEFNGSVADGTVAKQSVEANSQVKPGSSVLITVSKGPKAPDGWTTDGSFANNPHYRCETKTQYRKQTRTGTYDYKQSTTQSSMSGYEMYKTTSDWGGYGAWSDWSTNAVSKTDSRDVETKQETATTTTVVGKEFNYSHWVYQADGQTWYTWSEVYATARGGWYEERGWGEELYLGTLYDNAVYGTASYPQWFYEQVRDKTQTTSTPVTYYRYRTRSLVTTYYFRKWIWSNWSGWSEWQDSAIGSNDTTNVEKRTVYRYTAK